MKAKVFVTLGFNLEQSEAAEVAAQIKSLPIRLVLVAALELWQRQATSKEPAALQAVTGALTHWQSDADLAGVRGPKELAQLSDEERQQWQQLWADVDDLLKSAAAPKNH